MSGRWYNQLKKEQELLLKTKNEDWVEGHRKGVEMCVYMLLAKFGWKKAVLKEMKK